MSEAKDFSAPEQARRDKLAKLKAAGIDAYPVGHHRSHTLGQVVAAWGGLPPDTATGEEVTVAGRLIRKRGHGRLVFWTLRQGDDELQAMLRADVLGPEALAAADELDTGDWVGTGGEVVTSRRGELSVLARRVVLLGKALRPLPDKWHGLTDVEVRSRQRELDLTVNPAARAAVRLRTAVVQRLRTEMLTRGYVEVETPLLQPVPGGATARPFITHHNALDTDLYLRVAGELYLKRLLVGGMDRVFELGRMFRNEGMDARHNPEFTMLESNEAFADYRDMMGLARELVLAAAEEARGLGAVHPDAGPVAPGADHPDTGPSGTEPLVLEHQGRKLRLDGAWREVTVLDAVRAAVDAPTLTYQTPLEEVRALCDRAGVAWEPGWGVGKLVLELYEKHAEPGIWEPTFVIDYPAEVSPLAHPHRDDPLVTERFELVIGGREYANAYSELTDPLEQRERMEAQARARAGGDEEAMAVDEAYLRALELGLPPNAGLGIGVDRLVMLLGNLSSIREAVLFPQLRPEEQQT